MKLSIITVNYNGYQDTCELIESLTQNVTLDYEIIVVDNGSKRDEAVLLKDKYPHIISIRSEENLGFAGGNNIGIKQAKGDYIFLLNNDTFVQDDTFGYLIERLESDKKIGVVSPKIRFAFEDRHIQFAGYTDMTRITLRNSLIGYDAKDDGMYDTPCQTAYTHGAAMMLKREVIEKVGLMPQLYFLYYEELDYCQMIHRAGYTMWYEPKCTVFHKESRSTGFNSPFRMMYLTRNRLLFAYRNLTGIDKNLSILYQLLLVSPMKFFVFLLKGKTDYCKAIYNGCRGFFSIKNKMEML
ncbi:MAG: glycosyltransferase family 2 protein [Flavobacteriales bacterium]|nr:glycosyltransferase family 2 protein [Flavobacteriales bacterium]